MSSGYIVKLSGLSWSVTLNEIINFFHNCKIRDDSRGIHLLINTKGRPNGVAYVELVDENDLKLALSRDQNYIGSRCIEVFQSHRVEMNWALQNKLLDQDDKCIRLRGLPFRCSEDEIRMFLGELDIAPNGITILANKQGRITGEAFIQFTNTEMTEKALQKHRQCLRHRYIEVFRSSLLEMNNAIKAIKCKRKKRVERLKKKFAQPRDANQKNLGPFCIYMRGLPFRATFRDIMHFFRPLVPTNIHLYSNIVNVPLGEADVEFPSYQDCLKAMTKDKQFMDHRYIELFLYSTP